MTAAPDVLFALDEDTLGQIVDDVLTSMTMFGEPAPVEWTTSSTTATVTINGAWEGAVLVELPAGMDRVLAAAMFMMGPDECGDEEVVDAVGEFVNMIGGSVKSLMPEPSRLSLPMVVIGTDMQSAVPGTRKIAQAGRMVDGGGLRVSVWWQPPA